jgi:predicted O-methyltransferase YrrM
MDEKVNRVLDSYHDRMREEAIARQSGTADISQDAQDRRLLAVGPDTGQFINILVRSLKAPHILELGTSYGYSAIWLAEAARATGGRVTTIELQDYKSAYAREMSTKAGLIDYVDFKVGDALTIIPQLQFRFDFVLVDHWKDLYAPALEAFYPKLNAGAIVVADNMIAPGSEHIALYARAVRAKPNMTSIVLPIGQGLEVSRYDSVFSSSTLVGASSANESV